MREGACVTLHRSRVSSISFSVFSASWTLTEMSSEVTLASPSTLIRLSSSRMSPSDSARSFRILSSRSFCVLRMAAIETTSWFLASCSSGRSLPTTSPSSWSSSPAALTVKLSSVTCRRARGVSTGTLVLARRNKTRLTPYGNI